MTRARAVATRALAVLGLLAGAAAAAEPPALRLEPCRLPGVASEARCGHLARPLDPAAPGGPTIEVQVAVLPALARAKRPDPVLFLAGGPGQGAIDLAGHVARLLGRFGHRRDIVLVDVRGSGRSAALTCDDDPTVDLADPDTQVARVLACADALATRAPLRGRDDLRHFTTTIAADDVDAVRRALGAAQVNLVGVSYGTRLALEVLRRHPASVRRAVLDGVAPPDMALPRSFSADAQAALDALLRWCAFDATCQRRHPDLERQWRALLERLPVDVVRPDPLGGRDETLTLTRTGVLGLVRQALYVPLLASALPWAIGEAADGRWVPLLGLGSALGGGAAAPSIALGLHFAVICSEDFPRLADAGGDAPGADFGDAIGDVYRRVCERWPRGDVEPTFYRVPPSPVPVLLLSGGLDPVTPPRHGERVRAALGPLARHWVVDHAGHGVLGLACVRDAVFRFVDAVDAAPATMSPVGDCAAGVPRPPAWVPPDPRGAVR